MSRQTNFEGDAFELRHQTKSIQLLKIQLKQKECRRAVNELKPQKYVYLPSPPHKQFFEVKHFRSASPEASLGWLPYDQKSRHLPKFKQNGHPHQCAHWTKVNYCLHNVRYPQQPRTGKGQLSREAPREDESATYQQTRQERIEDGS